MTAENEGTGASDDDPFAYLYRQDGGAGGTASAQQPGVPRRSYNQVHTVGERSYGGQWGAQQAAPSVPYQNSHGQGSPSAHYAAPETVPGGRAAVRQQGAGGGRGPEQGQGHGRRGGGSRNGLLAGAVAVVAAVVIGIGSAMYFNSEGASTSAGDQAGDTGGNGGGGGGEKKPDEKQDKGDKKKQPQKKLPKEAAAALRLGGPAKVAKAIPGAKSRGGTYVGMNAVGSTATWKPKISKAGTYRLYVRYTVPGKNMHLSLGVNGQPHATGLSMENFAKAKKGDWKNGWTYTWATVQLDKGKNSFTISCQKGDACKVNIDQVWLEKPEKPEKSEKQG